MRVRLYTTDGSWSYPNRPRRSGIGGVLTGILQQGFAVLFAMLILALALTAGAAALLVALGLRVWGALPERLRGALTGRPARAQPRRPGSGPASSERRPEVIDAEFRILRSETDDAPERRSRTGGFSDRD